ncbi:sialic acid-binding Ig-like lectin 13 isoform X2 [Dendropsophus ebraccatus]|uniref:sialic acid-binding Ig-like lectin 13 isoform X2 n=1 Tax=Dendropsophus ebraccatus TaxID=150705 RepID=UPI003831AA78
MEAVKQVYLLLICQGFYLGSVCHQWEIPEHITALLGSCVEIPCTYDPAGRPGASSTLWFLYYNNDYEEILNTKDSSAVMEKYRGRTSLVPGNNSCTLRIDPVRREDRGKYYPGIIEDTYINAYKKPTGGVNLYVSDGDAEYTQFFVPEDMTEGEAATIRCSVYHTCGSSPPSLQYNIPGEVTHQSEEIYEGYWRGHWKVHSELTYIPSYEDDGNPVQCTTTYPNGRITERSKTMDIHYPPKHVTVTIIGKDEVLEGSDVTLQYAATGVHITMKNESKFTALICDFLSSRPDVTHYTWMKGGAILHNETEKTLTLYNNGENNGQYSCIAHNIAGNASSEEIWIKYDGFSISTIVLVAISGAICLLLLLLVLLVYCCWRGRCQKSKSNESETSPDATYTTLVKREMESDHEQYKILGQIEWKPHYIIGTLDVTSLYTFIEHAKGWGHVKKFEKNLEKIHTSSNFEVKPYQLEQNKVDHQD